MPVVMRVIRLVEWNGETTYILKSSVVYAQRAVYSWTLHTNEIPSNFLVYLWLCYYLNYDKLFCDSKTGLRFY